MYCVVTAMFITGALLALVVCNSFIDDVMVTGSGEIPDTTHGETNGTNRIGESQRLTRHLLGQHHRSSPPDGLIHVEIEIDLVQILGIDEVQQTMKLLVYVEKMWIDRTLSWNPAEFGGIEKHWLPVDDVWLPDILIINMVYHDNLLESTRAPVKIMHTGNVTYSFPAVYAVTCQIDIARFPLDRQHCPLEVASWEYDSHKMTLDVRQKYMTDYYSENEEWKLEHINVTTKHFQHEGVDVIEILYNVHVKRKPLFYIFSLILPSLIICGISVVGLFAPHSSTGEREEKFTLGVTAILTMAVLSLMVSEKVPHSSKNVPLLVAYFMFEMTVVTLATGMTGVLMAVHRRDTHGDDPPPLFICKLFKLGQFTWNKQTQTTPKVTSLECSMIESSHAQSNGGVTTLSSIDDENPVNSMTQLMKRIVNVLQALLDETRNIEYQAKAYESMHSPRRGLRTMPPGMYQQRMWMQLADRLDIICMILFMGILLTPPAWLILAGAFN